MNSSEIAQLLLSAGAVELRTDEPFFRFASGIRSPIYTDNRLLLADGASRDTVCSAFAARVRRLPVQPDVIAGTATAGIPHATLLARELGLPLVYVRGESKGHGQAKRIEGRLPPGARVVLVEDLVSTAGSVVSAARALRDAGAEVCHVLAIFSYGFTTATQRFEEAGLSWSSLSTFEDLLEQAVQRGLLDAGQRARVCGWSADPHNWPTPAAEAASGHALDELVVAADLDSRARVEQLGHAVSGVAGFIKLNSAFVKHGPDLVRTLVQSKLKIFLDLKFHDIPNTAANHVRAAGEMGVDLLTVHASGGRAMLRAAAEAARALGDRRPRVLAVTALTSLDEAALHDTGVAGSRSDHVRRLAALSRASGIDGIVCSVAEAQTVRAECGAGFLIVTPGVRPASHGKDDHAAAMTPAAALAAGADYVVVGRPIYQARIQRLQRGPSLASCVQRVQVDRRAPATYDAPAQRDTTRSGRKRGQAMSQLSRGGTVINAEVGIIGAGPAGTATAVALGQLGVRGIVLADKHGFPRDKTCGSGVSPKGIKVLRALGVWPEVEREATWIRGMRLVTPGDRESFLSAGGSLDAIVCKRRVLDHLLLKRAQRLGVTFVPECTATSLIEQDGRVVGFRTRQGHEVRARYTVVAGGTHCTLTTKGRPTPSRLIQAIMGWWEGVPHRSDYIEMIFDKMIAPYYGWLFPETDAVVNIGITYEDLDHSQKARELFQRFLDKHYADRLSGSKQLGKWKGHPIAYDYSVGDLTAPGQLVVGEAGRMTHPATAEGIYQGMQSGMYAAQAIRDILSGRRSEFVAFRTYEWRCKIAFEASFLAARIFRQLAQTPALDWMVSASENPAVQSVTGKVLAMM